MNESFRLSRQDPSSSPLEANTFSTHTRSVSNRALRGQLSTCVSLRAWRRATQCRTGDGALVRVPVRRSLLTHRGEPSVARPEVKGISATVRPSVGIGISRGSDVPESPRSSAAEWHERHVLATSGVHAHPSIRIQTQTHTHTRGTRATQRSTPLIGAGWGETIGGHRKRLSNGIPLSPAWWPDLRKALWLDRARKGRYIYQ